MGTNDKIVYISYVKDIEIEEEASIKKIENDKIYCLDTYNNYLIFNKNTGHCYNDNTTFGAKKVYKNLIYTKK
jgi:hypothetical protein